MIRRYRWFRGVGCGCWEAALTASPQWLQIALMLALALVAGHWIGRTLSALESWR